MGKSKIILIHGSAEDNMEAIDLCGKALYEAGVVRDCFAEKCKTREEVFPTGLPTEIPVAIPHCKDEGINENAICFLKLDKPVKFFRMDDDLEYVMTDMVFNLAIKDPNEHLETLQNMMVFVSDAEVLGKCRDLDDDELVTYLTENIC